MGRLYLCTGVFWLYLLFAKGGGVNEIVFLKILLFKENSHGDNVHNILKCLQFQLVQGEQHKGWI